MRTRCWRDGPLPSGHVPPAILFLDRGGHVTGYVPDSGEPVTGWHFGELYATDCGARGTPQHDLELAARRGMMEAAGWWRRADGSRFWAEITLAAVRVAGTPDTFTLVVHDATRERQAIAALHEAVRLRDEVVAVVSHDLRNPVGAAAMAAAMLEERGLGPELAPLQRQSVGIIRRATEQMSQMLGDLLDVARLEAGRLLVHTHEVSPGALLLEAAGSLGPQAETAGIELRVEHPAELPPVWADPDRLQQVFANLVSNAVKFTPRGGCITLSAWAEGGPYVNFAVRDTGCGILPEHIPHVFDRFWQATRHDRRGLGLGLAIVKGIVEAHGGRVWLDSEIGHGSTFSFSIPSATDLARPGHE